MNYDIFYDTNTGEPVLRQWKDDQRGYELVSSDTHPGRYVLSSEPHLVYGGSVRLNPPGIEKVHGNQFVFRAGDL